MKKYICFETGEVWTEEEIREGYEVEESLLEQYESFEEYLEHLLSLGRSRTSGLIEIEANSDGNAVRFEYNDIDFMYVVFDEEVEIYAERKFQFGFKLGTGGVSTDDDIITLIINNYENENMDI